MSNDKTLAGSTGEVAQPGRRDFLTGGMAVAAGAALATTLGGGSKLFAQAGSGPRQQFALIRQHENAHVTYLQNVLGSNARPKPTFQNLGQANITAFVNTAMALENTGTGAYLGAGANFTTISLLATAATIAQIEARHSGFLNSYRSIGLTQNALGNPQDFETPLTAAQVRNAAAPFFANPAELAQLDYSTTPSSANDLAILNFALALEYLESDFYNLGVAQFFGV